MPRPRLTPHQRDRLGDLVSAVAFAKSHYGRDLVPLEALGAYNTYRRLAGKGCAIILRAEPGPRGGVRHVIGLTELGRQIVGREEGE